MSLKDALERLRASQQESARQTAMGEAAILKRQEELYRLQQSKDTLHSAQLEQLKKPYEALLANYFDSLSPGKMLAEIQELWGLKDLNLFTFFFRPKNTYLANIDPTPVTSVSLPYGDFYYTDSSSPTGYLYNDELYLTTELPSNKSQERAALKSPVTGQITRAIRYPFPYLKEKLRQVTIQDYEAGPSTYDVHDGWDPVQGELSMTLGVEMSKRPYAFPQFKGFVTPSLTNWGGKYGYLNTKNIDMLGEPVEDIHRFEEMLAERVSITPNPRQIIPNQKLCGKCIIRLRDD